MGDPGLVKEREGGWLVWRKADVSLERVVEALRADGSMLKRSRKSTTRRMGAWVVKESRRTFLETVKHTVYRGRYRQSWRAALHLESRGVLVPRPLAFGERRAGPLVLGNAVVCEYLEGWLNVEDYARRMVREGAATGEVEGYLAGLADAVNGLNEAGAYHSDLSGKNIFTCDGKKFCFIDLDGVVIGRAYRDEMRLKNHVQLYDSFCDWWGEELLGPFIGRMLPAGRDAESWLARVKAIQRERRLRHTQRVGQ